MRPSLSSFLSFPSPLLEVKDASFYLKFYFFIGQSNGEVRLAVDGLATGEYTSGRVQVYYKGQWSNICSSGFSKTEANVICHQLGHDGANNFSTARNDS